MSKKAFNKLKESETTNKVINIAEVLKVNETELLNYKQK